MSKTPAATTANAHNDPMAEVERRFATRITNTVRDSIQSSGDVIARQYLPDIRELEIAPAESADPIGDQPHSPCKGIVHRHKNRVLLKAASVCAVNCRFCFRKNMLGKPEETLNRRETEIALDYIESHTEIEEVILTGGDPLILSLPRLRDILDRLETIPHISIIRFHSRIPVADPQRITPALCALLDRKTPIYMVIHVNHAQELTPDAEQALNALHRAGIVLLSQSVLLKDINDRPEALEALFRRLIRLRVKPYYLHHPDLVPGTGHFRVSIEHGQKLMRQLRARNSGIAMPSYILDIPGGYGKIPLEQAAIETQASGSYIVTDHCGNRHAYP